MKQMCWDNRQMLMIEIDCKRRNMVMVAKNTGLSSVETLKCSQELDSLLNRYEKIKSMYQKEFTLPSKLMRNMHIYFTGRYALNAKRMMNG